MPTDKNAEAMAALKRVIQKSRVHFYKPIQIAEILFRHRKGQIRDLLDLESYRNISKRWRDEASVRLVGRRCSSSQKYQDNLFEANATPPPILERLGKINLESGGRIEAYIYHSLKKRLSSISRIEEYIRKTPPEKFDLEELTGLFRYDRGLRRSIDKMYEILVYALFSALVKTLNARIKLEIQNKSARILSDFGRFIQAVLGITPPQTSISMPAALYRGGAANAADRGLDMWANFGPAIQVKHLSLTPELADDIVENVLCDKVVIVCLDAEAESIETLLTQCGWRDRIQSIITINDLNHWHKLCLSPKYRKQIGDNLLKEMLREFRLEFPCGSEIESFLRERGYDRFQFEDLD